MQSMSRPSFPSYAIPVETYICLEATQNHDLDSVKAAVQPFLESPECFFNSLVKAIEVQDLKIVRFLIDRGVARDLPVEVAVRYRAFAVLNLFLQYGWKINTPMAYNEPPALGIPLSTLDEQMIEWFLDHGADLNASCDWDLTPMSYAIRKAPIETIDYLFSRGARADRGELLQYAVQRDGADALTIVQRLVQHGAPVDKIKYENHPAYYTQKPFGLGTPLHRAAEIGNADVVKFLLESGADCRKKDSSGKIPRFWAEKRVHVEVVKLLREAEEQL